MAKASKKVVHVRLSCPECLFIYTLEAKRMVGNTTHCNFCDQLLTTWVRTGGKFVPRSPNLVINSGSGDVS